MAPKHPEHLRPPSTRSTLVQGPQAHRGGAGAGSGWSWPRPWGAKAFLILILDFDFGFEI